LVDALICYKQKCKVALFNLAHPVDSTSIPYLSTPAGPIQRVTIFKLLGLHLDANLSWMIHINTIVSKASKRLYFLKQLRRACVPPQQLRHF